METNNGTNDINGQKRLKIPTGKRQISWLFASVAGVGNNTCHQLVVRMGQKPAISDLKSGALTTRPRYL